jgi:hypothetical protein
VLEDKAATKTPLVGLAPPTEAGASVVQALRFQAESWMQGAKGLHIEKDWTTATTKGHEIRVVYGAFRIGRADADHLSAVHQVVAQFHLDMPSLGKCLELADALSRLGRVKSTIRDERADLRDFPPVQTGLRG